MAKVEMRPKKSLHLGNMGASLKKGLKPALRRVSKIIKEGVHVNLSGRILGVRTGKLRRSLRTEIVAINSGWQLAMGYNLSEVPYARIHEMGGFAGRNHSTKIPKRPYLRLAVVEAKVDIRNELDKWVTRLVKG